MSTYCAELRYDEGAVNNLSPQVVTMHMHIWCQIIRQYETTVHMVLHLTCLGGKEN